MVLGRGEGAPEEAPAGVAAHPKAAAVPPARAPLGAVAVLPQEGAPPGAGVAPSRPAARPEHPRMRPQRSQVITKTIECVHCHPIKNKIKNHAVDKVKKL